MTYINYKAWLTEQREQRRVRGWRRWVLRAAVLVGLALIALGTVCLWWGGTGLVGLEDDSPLWLVPGGMGWFGGGALAGYSIERLGWA